MKEDALEKAKTIGIDFVFFVDVDNFLINKNGKQSLNFGESKLMLRNTTWLFDIS